MASWSRVGAGEDTRRATLRPPPRAPASTSSHLAAGREHKVRDGRHGVGVWVCLGSAEAGQKFAALHGGTATCCCPACCPGPAAWLMDTTLMHVEDAASLVAPSLQSICNMLTCQQQALSLKGVGQHETALRCLEVYSDCFTAVTHPDMRSAESLAHGACHAQSTRQDKVVTQLTG